jgi:hypothetical protein
METPQVRYFLTLCQKLNFTRAAEEVPCRAAGAHRQGTNASRALTRGEGRL